ncbi:Sulfite oxidation cytochrome c-551 (fragment) [Cupriavidus taiwanensis]|uniref:Sulfite oxidation cytochrome c-551 n=1 Tax=Cupriavidus taiwanensis TaxID=164546 RepID=A0A375BTJ4_9BURK
MAGRAGALAQPRRHGGGGRRAGPDRRRCGRHGRHERGGLWADPGRGVVLGQRQYRQQEDRPRGPARAGNLGRAGADRAVRAAVAVVRGPGAHRAERDAGVGHGGVRGGIPGVRGHRVRLHHVGPAADALSGQPGGAADAAGAGGGAGVGARAAGRGPVRVAVDRRGDSDGGAAGQRVRPALVGGQGAGAPLSPGQGGQHVVLHPWVNTICAFTHIRIY